MCILEVMKYDNSLFMLGSQFDFFLLKLTFLTLMTID